MPKKERVNKLVDEAVEAAADPTVTGPTADPVPETPPLVPAPVLTMLAMVDEGGAVKGFELVWADEINVPSFGAQCLNTLKNMMGDVYFTSTMVAKLVGRRATPAEE